MAWGYFCLFYKKYIVYKIFNVTMHYPRWNYIYITVPSFMFRCVTVCELHFKRKKDEDEEEEEDAEL